MWPGLSSALDDLLFRDPEETQPCHSVKVTRLVETLSGSGAALTHQRETLMKLINSQPEQVSGQPYSGGGQLTLRLLVSPPPTHSQQRDPGFLNDCKADPTLGFHSPRNGTFTKTHLAQTGFCSSPPG